MPPLSPAPAHQGPALHSPTLHSPALHSPVRWWLLGCGVLCMVLIANLQYGWTLFVAPIQQAHGWPVARVQLAFSVFVALETWFTPVAGWFVDALGPRRGPKFAVALGGLLVATGWVMNGVADALPLLYAGSAVSGVGGGFVYATCVSNAVRWFPDRRGLAVGLTAAGFGAGAALTVIPIRLLIASHGYAATFIWFGIGQGMLLFLAAWLMRAPDPGEVPDTAGTSKVAQATVSATPGAMLRSPMFWLLYGMFVLVSGSGLMATAQIALVARSFGVSETVLLFGGTTLTVALIADNVMNGLARPFFGWISDRIGREATMGIAFGLGGLSYLALGSFGSSPLAFVVCAALIFFTWGEIFSLFPSTCADMFGPRYATVNTGLLYTAKGTSAWLVPLANLATGAATDWYVVFTITAATNFLVVLLALAVLKPMRSSERARAAALAG